MKKLSKFLLLIPAFLLMAGTAMALPMTLTFDDGASGALTVTDGGAGDSSGLDGVVIYSGPYGFNGTGYDWTVNVTTGISEPVIGSLNAPKLDLNSVNVSGAPGTLEITLWDDYLKNKNYTGIVDMVLAVGGTTDGTVQYEIGINGATALTTPLFGSGAFAFESSPLAILGDPEAYMDLSIKAIITHASAGDITSFDALLSPVPEPASMVLLGLGLLGIAGVSRRKS